MKVSDIHQKNGVLANIRQAHSNPSVEKNQKPEKVEAGTTSGDRVEFSARSREMQKIYEVLRAAPDMRSDKVSEIRKQIEEGRYRVDSETLAEKIIKESLLDLIK